MMKIVSFTFSLLLLFLYSSAQTPPAATPRPDSLKVVEILSAERYGYQKKDSLKELLVLVGKVALKQDNTLFYADSAVFNRKDKIVEAFKNVHINDNDSIDTYSEYLLYHTDTKIAILKNKVRLTDGKSNLYTEELEYDLNQKVGIYRKGGKVVNGTSTLTSIEGTYYSDLKDVYFRENVHLVDPKYKLQSDSLLYNTNTEIVTFITKTYIEDSAKRTIVTREGYYDLKNKNAQFGLRPVIKDGATTTIANDVETDDVSGLMVLTGNAIYKDTAQGLSLLANSIVVNKITGSLLATERPLMIIKQDKDSTFITADTLYSGKLAELDVPVDSVKTDSAVAKDSLLAKDISSLKAPLMARDSLAVKDSSTIKDSSVKVFSAIKDSSTIKDSSVIKNLMTFKDSSVVKNPITAKDSSTFKDSSAKNPSTVKDSSALKQPLILQDSILNDSSSLKKYPLAPLRETPKDSAVIKKSGIKAPFFKDSSALKQPLILQDSTLNDSSSLKKYPLAPLRETPKDSAVIKKPGIKGPFIFKDSSALKQPLILQDSTLNDSSSLKKYPLAPLRETPKDSAVIKKPGIKGPFIFKDSSPANDSIKKDPPIIKKSLPNKPAVSKKQSLAPKSKDTSANKKMDTDTIKQPLQNQNDTANRFFRAYRNVRIFSDSMQAVCDSLFYSGKDSIFRLFRDPIVWASKSQVTGDTIYMYTKNKKPDELYVFENGLMINETGREMYNQIKGNRLFGYFVEGDINHVRARGSAESIYYAKDSEDKIVGINKATSDIIDMRFKNRELNRVIFISDVKGTMLPYRQAKEEDKKLRSFKWHEDKRPKSKFELFGN